MGFLRSLPMMFLSFFLAMPALIHAQLCNGSLGDPVVNITFGDQSNPGSTVFPPPNTYTYTSGSCPNDGFYTITRSTSGCFSNSWHTVNNDHTGNGAFMLVNASYDPGDFFLTTVDGLCPNTTYEFAAWLMNVIITDGIDPDVTFTIEAPDGTLLGQYSTGPITETGSATWKQYGLFFTTPADNPSVVIRMTNNAPGGIGNDIALDDITFRPCGPPININVQGSSATIDQCEGETETISFDADVSSAYLSPVFQWQSSDDCITWIDIPGAVSQSFQVTPAGPGNYRYRITVAEAAANGLKVCRISSNDILIVVHPKPVVDAGPPRVLITGQSLSLNGTVEGETPTYSWSPVHFLSDPLILNPLANPNSDITYILSATSAYGCSAEDEVTIKVVEGIYIPTAFTPNNDHLNDTWRIPYLDPAWDPQVIVYNRYGQPVYQAKGTSINWDGTFNGTKQATGVYIYIVKLRGLGLEYKGTLTLIR